MSEKPHPPAKKIGPATAEFLALAELTPGIRFTRSTLHASGGMGAVWLAVDSNIGREVALKELKADGVAGAARFVREAKITGQLEHPGVVPVYELGQDAETGRPFYVMRFVRGKTFCQVVRQFHADRRDGRYDPLALVRLLSAFVSVCHTIAYAHSRGVIHRDLKGENVILGEFGEVVVLDWGVAKRIDADFDDAAPEPGEKSKGNPKGKPCAADTAAIGQTRAGEVVGTVAYMAPEQAEGRSDLLGPHTDVFGLGALLYEVLTGVPPYSNGTYQNLLLRALLCSFPPPSEHWPELPTGLEALCLKAMSKDPADRQTSAVELGREVQEWQDYQRRRAENDLREAHERLRRQQKALVALTRSEVFAGNDLPAILRRLVEVSARTLRVARVGLWRLTLDRTRLRCDVLYELDTGRTSFGTELRASDYPDYFAALATTEVVSAEDARTDPRTREFAAGYLVPLGIGAMMEVPVHPNGVLCHEHVGPPRRWLPDEELFAIAAGHLAALAISHWERRQVLEQLGVADAPPT